MRHGPARGGTIGRCVASLLLGCGLLASCADDAPPGGVQPCSSNADCDDGACMPDPEGPDADLEPLELACGTPTSAAKAGEPCEAADDCANGLCLLAGACADVCADDGDCSMGQRCQDGFARTSPEALQPLRACVARVDLPAAAAIDVQLREGALSGGDDVVELDLGMEPSLFVLEHLDDDRWPGAEPTETCRPPLCLDSLTTTGSDAQTLWDRTADSSQTAAINPVATGSHIFVPTLLLANGSAPLPTGASFEVRLTSEVAGDLRVTRLSHTPRGLGLDLNVFYVGALDWEPTGSRGPAELEQALEEVDRIFAPAGLFIAEVRQLSVPGALPETGTTFPDGDPKQGFAHIQQRFNVLAELPALFELSAGAANTAVNLFFVADIDATDGELEGLSGGIPGPLGMHGTGSSGIAIATDMMQGDPVGMGRTVAHEIGHFLGLFHTSERDGSAHDPLSDTPQCELDRDADASGDLSIDECAGAGADNLMFFSKTESAELSPEQVRILQRALVLH